MSREFQSGSEFQSEGGDDPVRRRELLARAAGLAGATALGLPTVSSAHALTKPGGRLDDLLYGSADAEPVSVAALRRATTQARGFFQTARYDSLATVLPRLIATAVATRDSSDGHERAAASALLADAHAKGWATVIPFEAWAGGLAAAILIGAAAGLLPALKAARMSPTQALWSL